jgi:hypothetical protein
MSETSSSTTPTPQGQSGIPSLEVSLSSVLVGLAALIANPILRTVLQLLAPPTGYGLAALGRWSVARVKRRIEKPDPETLIKSWIKEAERRRDSKGVTQERKLIIEEEIEEFYLLLKNHRLGLLQTTVPPSAAPPQNLLQE